MLAAKTACPDDRLRCYGYSGFEEIDRPDEIAKQILDRCDPEHYQISQYFCIWVWERTKLKSRLLETCRSQQYLSSLAVVRQPTGDKGFGWSLNGPLQPVETSASSIFRGQPYPPILLRSGRIRISLFGYMRQVGVRKEEKLRLGSLETNLNVSLGTIAGFLPPSHYHHHHHNLYYPENVHNKNLVSDNGGRVNTYVLINSIDSLFSRLYLFFSFL